MGVKKSEYIKESNVQEDYHNYMQGTGDLLGVEEDNEGNNSGRNVGGGQTNAIDDLLGMSSGPSSSNAGGSSLLEMGGG